MPVIFYDLETRSTLDLPAVGAWRYSGDASTEVLCIAFAVDDEPVQLRTPEQPIPEAFIQAARDPSWLTVAHNDGFERAIERRLLGPRYGWPQVPIERRRCSMAMALASALPGSLEGAATALSLPISKDAEGKRLMKLMARPRKPRKGEDPAGGPYWNDSPEMRARLYAYCRRDVEVERMLCHRLSPLSESEQALWALDAIINERGFPVDVELAEAARRMAAASLEATNAEIAELTDGAITTVGQIERITEFVRDRGHQLQTLGKRSVAAVLACKSGERDAAHRLLELRQEGGKASAGKFDALLRMVDNGRISNSLKFHGTSTGRWSGAGFQPQNLTRQQPEDSDAAIAAVLSGDIERVRAIGKPLDVVSSLSRASICAAPGHVLIGADYSQIEARVLAWVAGEEWLLAAYRKFDDTGDPAFEPYCIVASKIFRHPVAPEDEERQVGKSSTLSFGYGGSVGAFRRIAPDSGFTDNEIEAFKNQWRQAHPKIVAYWHDLYRALKRALTAGTPIAFRNLVAEKRGANLYLRLPSGRELAYPEAHLEPGKFDNDEIVFKDNARGGWNDARGWFGVFVENVVSAVARDLLVNAMPKIEAAGYPIVLSVHDELIAEVPESFGSAEEYARLMTALPPWAAGLPLMAKGWRRQRYAKGAKSAPAEPADSIVELLSEVDDAEYEVDIISSVFALPAAAALPSKGALGAAAEAADAVIRAAPNPPKGNGYAPWEGPSELPEAVIVGAPELAPELAPVPATVQAAVFDIGEKLLCPFHDDTSPSLHVYPDHLHCFSCDANLDHVEFVMIVENVDRATATRLLEENPPGRRAGAQLVEEENAETLAYTTRLFAEAVPIAGTPAARYLAEVRGIDLAILPDGIDAVLRFHDNCPFGGGRYLPCLVALFRDVESDEPAGIHRIALTPKVLAGEKVKRLTLGRWPRPRAIKLWPVTDRLFLAEGIETALAGAHFRHRGAPMQPAWAAGSAHNIERFPVLPGVELTLLVDHDDNGAGERTADACRARYRERRLEVGRRRTKKPHKDFNDLLIEQNKMSVPW